MQTTRAFKIFSEVLLFAALIFTAVCFVDTWRMPFFLNFDYRILKLALSFVLPFSATIINYFAEKNFRFAGRAVFFVIIIFIIAYIADQLTIKWISYYGSFVIIFHLSYAMIAVFSVFLAATVIKFFTKKQDNGYNLFFNNYFAGFALFLTFEFILIYFVIRNYGQTEKGINLIPFKGEIYYTLQSLSKYEIIRTLGNVLFYSAMSITVARFAKKYKSLFAFFTPLAVSILCEITQYVLKCGEADIDDVITNTLGALLGTVFYIIVIKPLLNIKEKKI